MKLSILLSTYNHEKYIREALDSILMQKTDFEYELIVLDDASTDNNQKIILEYKDKFKNIKLLFNKKNHGGLFSHRMGKYHAQGEYLAFLEGDDYWTDPNKLTEQIKILDKNKELVGCSHNTELFYESDNLRKIMIEPGTRKEIHTIRDLIEGNSYFHTSSFVWRNIFKNGYPKELSYNKKIIGDWFLSMFYAKHGNILYIDKVMSCYRITGKGAWTSLSEEKKFFNNLRGLYTYNKLLRYKYKTSFERIEYECKNLMNIIKSKEKFPYLNPIYLKTFFLRRSVDTNNNHIFKKLVLIMQKKLKLSSKITAPFLLTAQVTDFLIIKFFEFLFNVFILFDVNRYFIYYKTMIYRFFKINIYKL